MGGACGTYGRRERCAQVLVGNPEKKRPLGDQDVDRRLIIIIIIIIR